MEKVQRLRAMGSLCRQQAAYNSMNKWKLLAEAEYWEHLAQLELSSYFQECNAVSSDEVALPEVFTDANDTQWNDTQSSGKNKHSRLVWERPFKGAPALTFVHVRELERQLVGGLCTHNGRLTNV